MSKVIDRNEVGKVFSLMTALDTTAPMFSSTLYTFVFKYTIDSYPGTVFQMTALLMFIPIMIVMWIDLFTVRPIDERKKVHKNTDNMKQLPINNTEYDSINNNVIQNETKM